MHSPPSRSKPESRPPTSDVIDSAAPDAAQLVPPSRTPLASCPHLASLSNQPQPAVESVSLEIGLEWYLISNPHPESTTIRDPVCATPRVSAHFHALI